jgi:hypothetical protein
MPRTALLPRCSSTDIPAELVEADSASQLAGADRNPVGAGGQREANQGQS